MLQNFSLELIKTTWLGSGRPEHSKPPRATSPNPTEALNAGVLPLVVVPLASADNGYDRFLSSVDSIFILLGEISEALRRVTLSGRKPCAIKDVNHPNAMENVKRDDRCYTFLHIMGS